MAGTGPLPRQRTGPMESACMWRFSPSSRRGTTAETLATSGGQCAHLRPQKTVGAGALDAAELALPNGGGGDENRTCRNGGRQ
jgi:hypothetical protein